MATSSWINMVHECGAMGRLELQGFKFERLKKFGLVQIATIDDNPKNKKMVEQYKSHSFYVRCEKKVKVRLRIDHQVQFGDSHAILGSAPCVGAWQETVPLHWTESGWVVELEANPQETLEYKHIIVTHSGDVVWEAGPNRVLLLPNEGEFEIVTHWDCTNEELQSQVKNGHLETILDDSGKHIQTQGLESTSNQQTTDGIQTFSQRWQRMLKKGEQTRMMKWDTTGLNGSTLQIVESDKNARNWWQKLELACMTLTSKLVIKDRLKTLVNILVYLKWINTGQITCCGDGQHYPINKHAEFSQKLFVELERISSEQDINLMERIVVRKIHPFLPTIQVEATNSILLTRIQDIVLRHNIPEDLKQEIQNKLQNKLHCSVGLEYLVATEELLVLVTKKLGELSEEFIKEFKTFHLELKDFFNVMSLIEQLEALRPSMAQEYHAILEHFLWSKDRLQTMHYISGANIIEPLLDTIHATHNLRKIIAKELESGIQGDASNEFIATRQKWRMSELGLEDYSSILLSKMINAFEGQGGALWLSDQVKNGKVGQWTPALTSLAMGVQQLGLSGLQLTECIAINNELLAWSSTAVVSTFVAKDTKAWALRLKATVNRVCRLASSYSDTILQVFQFSGYVEKLGNAFGILENPLKTYAEVDIQESVAFQIAKFCSMLLKAIRELVGGDGFDALMPGRAAGMLVEVDKIVRSALPSSTSGPLILLVRKANGNEEVKTIGSNIAGIILQHELSHLSQLSVWARQEKIVFVTCEDETKITNLRPLLNRPVEFVASSEFLHIRPYELVPPKEELKSQLKETLVNDEQGPSYIRLTTLSKVLDPIHHSIVRSPLGTVLDLSKATIENSGSKATICGILASLTEQAKTVRNNQGVLATFCVPDGKVIPFGALEDALESSASLEKFNTLVEKVEIASLEGGKLDNTCNELRSLIVEQEISKDVLDGLALKGFSKSNRLIVRSSANVEDLAGMSGAGLYESVPNVRLSEPESFGKAVAQVWASLFTKRAVLSRRIAKVPQKEASMAILVQELLNPQLSFILHTMNPIDHDNKILQAELAVGLGETLTCGTLGTPWRLVANKFDGTVRTLSFANFSEQSLVQDNMKADGTVLRQIVDYSSQNLSSDFVLREQVGQRLAAIGFFLEQHFHTPQDIEGCIVGEDVYIVQSRPQP